ncbi:MAG: homoserine O-acetyltransferase [Chitinophagaceae bacterium]
MQLFHHKQPFELETGTVLPELTIAYHTYGRLNEDRSNVVWVCHALTANSDVLDWWTGVTGHGHVIDPDKYFIVCANIVGSCYGTSGPLSINPETNAPYYSSFPVVTVRDMVRAHILLREHLGLDKIFLLAGGSMGGYQAMEWCVMQGEGIENLLLLATSASESAWGIAVHTAQRLAIEADPTWKDDSEKGGGKGLKAARAMGLLTYRNYDILVQKQTDPDVNKLDNYMASSYINYQGDKLVNRFNAYSYWLLTKAMDSHQLARGRKMELAEVLHDIKPRTLVIGITSDIHCPLSEQHFLAGHIPNASMVEIDSVYGHDGFMVEAEKIAYYVQDWLTEH